MCWLFSLQLDVLQGLVAALFEPVRCACVSFQFESGGRGFALEAAVVYRRILGTSCSPAAFTEEDRAKGPLTSQGLGFLVFGLGGLMA